MIEEFLPSDNEESQKSSKQANKPMMLIGHQLQNLISLNKSMDEQKKKNKENTRVSRLMQNKDVDNIIRLVQNGLDVHRMNMLNLGCFIEYFTFERIISFLKIDDCDQLNVLEMFIKCQLEERMGWIYVLEEEIVHRLTPAQRITVRKTNRGSNFYTQISKISTSFPIDFLNTNLNTHIFLNEDKAGFRIINIGLTMILCNLRSGFYTFEHLSNLLTFVRQKHRFLKTWKGDPKWESEGQWFMVKFVKQCLFLLVDYIYEQLIMYPDELDSLCLKKNKVEKESMDSNKTPHSETPKKQGSTSKPQGFNLSELLEIAKSILKEASRSIEENLLLLEEIFANSVLGWTACGDIAEKIPRIDEEILYLSEYFFNMNQISGEFEPPEIVSLQEQGGNEEKLSQARTEVIEILEDLKNPMDMTSDLPFILRIKKLLKFVIKETYLIKYQVKLAYTIRNVIELLISLYEYYFHKSINFEDPNPRKMTTSSIVLGRMGTRKASAISPSVEFSAYTLSFDEGDINLQEKGEWEEVLNLITKISMKYPLVYFLTADDYNLWSLLKSFPRVVLRVISKVGNENICRDADHFLNILFELFVNHDICKNSGKGKMRIASAMIYGLNVLKEMINTQRENDLFNYQFEMKVFNLIKLFFNKYHIEEEIIKLAEVKTSNPNILGEEVCDEILDLIESQIDYSREFFEGSKEKNSTKYQREITYNLIYKVFEILEICSQRFCSKGFDKSDKLNSTEVFMHKILSWSYLTAEDKEVSKKGMLMNRVRASIRHIEYKDSKVTKLRADTLLDNINLAPLLSKAIKMQTNLFINASNVIIDDFYLDVDLIDRKRGKDKIFIINNYSAFELINHNFTLAQDSRVVDGIKNPKTMKVFLKIVEAIIAQVVAAITFLDVMNDKYSEPQLVTFDNLVDMIKVLKTIFDGRYDVGISPTNGAEEDEDNSLLSGLFPGGGLEKLQEFLDKNNIIIELSEFKRIGIYGNEENRNIFILSTKYSLRQINYINTTEQRFCSSLKTSSSFEVDIKEILKGFCLIFIRVFGSMYSGRANDQLENQNWSVRSRRYYFFNKIYPRFFVLFERLSLEFPDFKTTLRAVKTLDNGIGPQLALSNIFDTLLRLNKSVWRSIYFNSDWSILFSHHYIVTSLLQNLTEQEFGYFKSQYGKMPYSAPDYPLADKQESFLIVLVNHICSMMRSMRFSKMAIRKDIPTKIELFNSENYAQLKIIIDFLTSCVGDNNKNESIIARTLVNSLLNFLLYRITNMSGDTTALKLSTTKLLIQILKKKTAEKTFAILNQNGLELKIIYEYTLFLAKVLVCQLIVSHKMVDGMNLIKFKKAVNLQKPFPSDREIEKQDSGSSKNNSTGKNNFAVSTRRVRSRASFYTFNNLDTLSNIEPNKFGKRKFRRQKTIMSTRRIFEVQDFLQQPIKGLKFEDVDFERTFITNAKLMIDAYTLTDSKNIGFHLLASLLTIMLFFEKNHGGKYWSLRRIETDKFYSIDSLLERQKATDKIREEMAIVRFLTQINKEIEIVDEKGKHKIIMFQNYPELVNLRELVLHELFGNFDGEMILHKVIKQIPQTLIQVKYYHRFNIESPTIRRMVTDEALWRYRAIIWYIGLLLSLICMMSYQRTRWDGSILPDDTGVNILINIIAGIIGILSLAQSTLWLYTRHRVIKQVKMEELREKNSRITLYIYIYTIMVETILLEETIISVLLHVLFSILGIFYSPIFHSMHLLMFVFISKLIRRVFNAVVKNILEMALIFIFAILIIYMYSVITLIYYSDDFRTDETREFDVCQTLWGCFFNVLNLGLRMGGGIASSMTQIYSTHFRWGPKVIFDITFFIFINVIALNMVFGIIIDTFSSIREKESHKSKYLPNRRIVFSKLLSCVSCEEN